MDNKNSIFKKWWLWVTLLLLFLLVLFIIISNNKNITNTSYNNTNNSILNATDILTKLKEKNSNIGNYVVYTEETDLNNLLGRPNQYTSKVTFEDIRLEQSNKKLDPLYFSQEEINEPIGGTIEVFANENDMQKRKTYVESITSSMSLLAEYNYSHNNILLRINKGLTPSQAKEYGDIFNSIFTN